MGFPEPADWFEWLAFLNGFSAVYILLVAAVIIVFHRDWRLVLFSLAVQYLVAGVLFAANTVWL